ncbi:hypothetical protein G7Y89_g11208 [Cudoniella acicularis]|uniref:Uncharacterized protein n=1 Tax=Cudoniella acicularis TaxID=354080 RepID=A0A8H4RCD1_9HELO|nr:hypothetical protein G7Y89_g11208 [Cudoniella acicularis]
MVYVLCTIDDLVEAMSHDDAIEILAFAIAALKAQGASAELPEKLQANELATAAQNIVLAFISHVIQHLSLKARTAFFADIQDTLLGQSREAPYRHQCFPDMKTYLEIRILSISFRPFLTLL